jgi:hypothetical protein
MRSRPPRPNRTVARPGRPGQESRQSWSPAPARSRVDACAIGESGVDLQSDSDRPSHPSKLRGGMNTRASGSPPSRRLAQAILLAVVALVLPCASARAECGSHGSRPTIPLEWTRVAASMERSESPGRVPTCSGLNCSRNTSFPPMASIPKSLPRLDLCDAPTPEPVPDHRAGSWSERSEEFHPIGRETKVERPPCRSNSAE